MRQHKDMLCQRKDTQRTERVDVTYQMTSLRIVCRGGRCRGRTRGRDMLLGTLLEIVGRVSLLAGHGALGIGRTESKASGGSGQGDRMQRTGSK